MLHTHGPTQIIQRKQNISWTITYLEWARRCSNTDNLRIDFVSVASNVLNIPGDRVAFDPMLRFHLLNLVGAADTLD